MQNAWRAYLEMALGLTEAPRKRAQKVAGEVLAKGGATAGQLQGLVDDLVSVSTSNREALTNLVRYEVDRALGRVGLATAEEVADLTTRVKDLEKELAEARSGESTAEPAVAGLTIAEPGPVNVTPPAASTAPVKKAAPAPARKVAPVGKGVSGFDPAPAKRPVAKKAVAKKAVPAVQNLAGEAVTPATVTPATVTPASVVPASEHAVPAKATKVAKAAGAAPAKKATAPGRTAAAKKTAAPETPEGAL